MNSELIRLNSFWNLCATLCYLRNYPRHRYRRDAVTAYDGVATYWRACSVRAQNREVVDVGCWTDGRSVDQRGNTKRYRFAKYNTKARDSTTIRHDTRSSMMATATAATVVTVWDPWRSYCRPSVAFVDGNHASIILHLESPRADRGKRSSEPFPGRCVRRIPQVRFARGFAIFLTELLTELDRLSSSSKIAIHRWVF